MGTRRITNLIANVNPGSDDPADVAAAAVADIRMNRLFIDPCYRGEYPADVVAGSPPPGSTPASRSTASCSRATWR